MLAVGWLLVNVPAQGGGSGLNTVVIANQLSSNSCELANYYCEKRQIPPDHVLRLPLTNGNSSWSAAEFQTNLLSPLLTMLAERGLTNQIDYVVLSMDIPYTTFKGSTANSTTAALFYGLSPDALGSFKSATNSYAFSESVFREAPPASAPGYSFLCTMLTADSLAAAKRIVDQGAASDGVFPTRPVVLAKSSDPYRNARYTQFDNALINAELLGNVFMYRTNSDVVPDPSLVAGLQTGLANFSVPAGTFSPGAIADSLSSFGGVIFGAAGQTTLLAFIDSGASGSYGTVAEPYLDLNKFPDASVYFLQSRGFSLAESYYQALKMPYLGLMVGEPLAAPFASFGYGRWGTNTSNAVLTGTAPLTVRFSSRSEQPLQQVDLFVDGTYFQTITNISPIAGNILTVTINGYPVTCTVESNASLRSVTAGLAAALNAPVVTNATKVVALARGDRVELRALTAERVAESTFFPVTAAGSNTSYRIKYIDEIVPPLLSPPVSDRAGTFRMHIETPQLMPYVIEASTNLAEWTPIFTNETGGTLNFVDPEAGRFAQRYYRVGGLLQDQRPRLSLAPPGSNSLVTVHIEGAGAPYRLESSTNLVNWSVIVTNPVGGNLEVTDGPWAAQAQRFYRAAVVGPEWPLPAWSVVTNGPFGTPLVRVDGAVLPYVLEAVTNGVDAAAVATNLSVGTFKLSASSASGSAGAWSTFVQASRSTFLDSPAFGLRAIRLDGTGTSGAWIRLAVTRTNGLQSIVSVTNQGAAVPAINLVQQLAQVLSSRPDLLGKDGLVAQDLSTNGAGTAMFNLCARSPGLSAAMLSVQLTASAGLTFIPSFTATLTQNLADLQPRNHLYLSVGANSLPLAFSLDTTRLPDGFHELTAVAYEGTEVRTQTRLPVPVQVQNTTLTAELNLLDLGETAPVQGMYQLQVVANTNATLSLFSTGGLLQRTVGSSAIFVVNGTTLGAGLHPFYAMAETPEGRKYRTRTAWVSLVNGAGAAAR